MVLPEDPAPEALLCGGGRSPVRRLTREEYNNTVRDLLGDTTGAGSGFAPEQAKDGFLNNADVLSTDQLLVDNYMTGAEAVAADALRRGVFTLPCAQEARNCAASYIADFGRKAFRRPLEQAEVDSYLALFEAGAASGFETGLSWVTERMLQSVHFLYRLEPLEAGGGHGLSSHAIATRLSYFLWKSSPDTLLLDAADQGALATVPQVEQHVARMMQDPRFEQMLGGFHRNWITYGSLGSKLKESTPAWDDALKADLNQEADRFIVELFKSGGTYADLFTANFSVLNPRLAQFYGVPAPAVDGFQRVDNLSNRHGVLTLGSFLASHATNSQSNPVKRGVVVRERLLCQHLPPPPNDIMVMAPEPREGATTRERFEEHSANAVCSACHQLIDPVGMGFERYDEFGRYRETDQGLAIDDSGNLLNVTLPPGTPSEFNGVAELAQLLANSAEGPECMTTQWLRYTLGRSLEDSDECAIQALHQSMTAANWKLSGLVTAIATSDLFRHRAPEATPAEENQ